jgi:hypothetical protein
MNTTSASALLLLLTTAGGLQGQRLPAYLPQPEPLRVESVNPHLMYFVAAGDTFGMPVEAVAVETARWTREGGGLRVVVEKEELLPEPSTSTDTFHVAPDGRVERINGAPPGIHGRIDLLPRLPRAPLAVGTRWTDTLHAEGAGAAGEHLYRVVREYHVARMVDTVGTRVVVLESSGEVRYRDGWWTDSTETARVWIDVSGPVHEVAAFDPERGVLLHRAWEMHLRGEGGIPGPGGRELRVEAGLRSGSRSRVVSEERLRILRKRPAAALEPD